LVNCSKGNPPKGFRFKNKFQKVRRTIENEEFWEGQKMNSARGRNESIDDRDELSHVPAPKAPTTPKPKLSENGNKKLTQIIALKNGENNKHVSCLGCAQCRAAAPNMHPAT
jgi:hypothetical protein